MQETFSICGYTRISVDLEEDRDNTSIENQKAIIEDYVRQTFPGSTLDLYVDRDRSGYTFSQREQYQVMRSKMLSHKYDILIVKDLSRFSRRNSYGLVELETLRDAGIRIIAIGDSIDYPTNDDWLRIQIYFFMNEMPVTDTSKKVRNVIKRRQADGKWICSVPYGYRITNTKTMAFEVDEPAAEIVRKVFELYNFGWGYKRIANWLTEQHIPTPRMNEIAWKKSKGEDTKLQARDTWSIITVQGILDNDFYIGTLRQGKYARKTINGADVKKDESEHQVFENNHEAIVDARTFAITRELRSQRTRSNYRGVKKYENAYSGLLYCGSCGSPMFSMSRADLRPAYVCGAYHRRGLNGCTSHHTRVDCLDSAVKHAIRQVRDNAAGMVEYLQKSITEEEALLSETKDTAVSLEDQLARLQKELKAVKGQKLRDCLRDPDNTDIIEETYDAIEHDLTGQIAGVKNQLRMSGDKRNTVIQANRTAKTVIEVFDRILNADSIGQDDLQLVVERITVYDDAIEVQLKSDVRELLCCGVCESDELPEDAVIVQESAHRPPKELKMLIDAPETANVISSGEPSLIRTEADEVTYCLHVMIRYELEKAVLAGELAVHDLPEAWNRLYKEYLGVTVPDDRHGVLQDSHWSGGSIGYFPSYALGSAYGAQFLRRMKESIDVEKCVAAGDFAPINAWNREHIWQYGCLYTPAQLLERVLGEPFDPMVYCGYLEQKCRDIYGI